MKGPDSLTILAEKWEGSLNLPANPAANLADAGLRPILAFIIVIAIVFLALVLPASLSGQGRNPSQALRQQVPGNLAAHPAPAQPIPYSHKQHLAMGLQCQLCHTNPEPGAQMTFPATATCMKCHASIATEKPSIQKLAAFAKSGEPIPWVRVYTVTPGVTWTHRKHLAAGMRCETCHGQVAQMDTMSEATSVLAMGVCINCHVQNRAPTTCQSCHSWPSP